MKVAVISMYPRSTRMAHSGVNDFIFSAVQRLYPGSAFIAPDRLQIDTLERVRSRLARMIPLKRGLPLHSEKASRCHAAGIQGELTRFRPDFIISTTPLVVAYLDFDCPLSCYTDAVLPCMLDYYPEFTNVADSSAKQAIIVEKLGFGRTNYAYFTSNWAREAALNHGYVEPRRSWVIPRPANIQRRLTNNELKDLQRRRINSSTRRLLFVGMDWRRKGGDEAYEVAKAFSGDFKVRLDIAGARPPRRVLEDPIVSYHGFLDKSIAEDASRLTKLYEDAHLFILPTKAEAMGIAFNEASAYGLPIITNNTGGVSEVVDDPASGVFLNIGCRKEALQRVNQLLELKESYLEASDYAWLWNSRRPDWSEAVQKLLRPSIS